MRFFGIVSGSRAVLALALAGIASLQADARSWTSTAGTTLEGEYVAAINGRLWLKETTGRLVKVEASQLIATDQAFVNDAAVARAVLRATAVESDAEALIDVLAAVDLPTYHVNDILLKDALDRLSADIAKAAPAQPRVLFDAGALGERCKISLLLRERTAASVLAFICRNFSLEIGPRLVEGRLQLRSQPLGSASEADARSKESRPEEAPTSVAVGRADEKPNTAESVCTAPISLELYQSDYGFEQSPSHWLIDNRKSSFVRASVLELQSWPGGLPHGAKVMMIKPTRNDGDGSDGPPYFTREIQLPRDVKRIRVCCDLAYAGALTGESRVRLSVMNPEVKYLRGGRTFPFTWVRPTSPRQWRHVEWEADVSDMGSRRLAVGVMFPYSPEAWYVDNVKISVAGP